MRSQPRSRNFMVEDKVFPVDPVTLKLADGVSRELRYSNLSLKRIRQRLKRESFKQVMDLPFNEVVATLIYEGLVQKIDGPTTHDEDNIDCGCVFCQIDGLIDAADLNEVQAVVLAAITKSTPEQIKNELRRRPEENQTPAEATLQ